MLLFLRICEIDGMVCDVERELHLDTIPAISIVNEKECKRYFIGKYALPTRMHCLDLCSRTLDCRSVNYDEQDKNCLLFNLTIGGMLVKRCLYTNDDYSQQEMSQVQISSKQTDVKTIDRTKLCL